jgi:pyridoxamine 5'-phosphate oxidase
MTPAAHDYLSPLPPGSKLDRPLPARGTREYFAVATATVGAVDWLELRADGQRRASFDEQSRHWVAP